MKTGLVLVVLCGLAHGASWKADLAEAKRLEGAGETVQAARVYQSIADHAKGLVPFELNDLALELFYAGRYSEAESVYHEALVGWERMGEAGRRDRIVTAANLGTLLRAEGRYTESERIGRASLAGLREKLPQGDPRLLRALENQARLLAGTRRPKDAAALRERIDQMGRAFRKAE